MSMRRAASCGQPLQDRAVPRGARIGWAGRRVDRLLVPVFSFQVGGSGLTFQHPVIDDLCPVAIDRIAIDRMLECKTRPPRQAPLYPTVLNDRTAGDRARCACARYRLALPSLPTTL